jgi:hypothetical protein
MVPASNGTPGQRMGRVVEARKFDTVQEPRSVRGCSGLTPRPALGGSKSNASRAVPKRKVTKRLQAVNRIGQVAVAGSWIFRIGTNLALAEEIASGGIRYG